MFPVKVWRRGAGCPFVSMMFLSANMNHFLILNFIYQMNSLSTRVRIISGEQPWDETREERYRSTAAVVEEEVLTFSFKVYLIWTNTVCRELNNNSLQ